MKLHQDIIPLAHALKASALVENGLVFTEDATPEYRQGYEHGCETQWDYCVLKVIEVCKATNATFDEARFLELLKPEYRNET